MKLCFTSMVRLFGLLTLLWIIPQGAQAQCSLTVQSSNNPLCALVPGGNITVSMANGLNYQLMPGNVNVSNGVFNNLYAGTYTITGIDGNNCTASTVHTLTDPPTIIFGPSTITMPTCNGISNGTITAGATGGTGTITYCLTPNVQPCNTTGYFTGLAAGGYTVTATDANVCIATTVAYLTQPTAVGIVSATFTPLLCNGNSNGTILATANGGTGPLTYTIAPLGPQTNTTGMFNALNAQTYTVMVTDANNCSSATIVNMPQPNLLTFTGATSTPPTCNGWNNGQISVIATGGTASTTYTISPSGPQNNTTGNFTNLTAQCYTVTVTDVNACTSTTAVCLTQPPAMVTTISNVTTTVCGQPYSGSIVSQASGGVPPYSFAIFPNIGLPTTLGTFINLASTNYTINVTDANGCTTTVTAFVASTPSPQMPLSNFVNPSCPGVCNGSMTYNAVNGVPPYTFTINPNIPFSGGVVNNICNGIYTMTVMDANGCTAFMTHNFNGQSGLGFNNTVSAVSCGTNCTGSIVPQATGGTAPYTYAITGNQYNNLCVGNYTLTASDANACTNTTVIQLLTGTVNQTLYPNVSLTPGSITATPSGGTAPYQYSLNGSPFTTNNSFTYLCSGTYTLTVKDSYFGGCLKDTVVTLQAANTLPGVMFNSNIIQPACPLSQDGAIQVMPVPSGTYTYVWSNAATGPGISNLNADTFTVTITNAANACIELTYTLTATTVNCGNISGTVFYDSIPNCLQSILEPGIPGTMITANPGNHITFTDGLGNYSFPGLPYGTYTLTHANNVNAFATACGNNPSVSISNGQPNFVQHFGDTNTIFTDYQVWVTNPNCFMIAAPVKMKQIQYKLNNPTISSTGTVYAVFDSIQHFLSANPVPTAINGNVVSWNVSNINSNASAIMVYFSLPTTFTAANNVPFTVGINNLQYSDTNLLNNQINYTFPICNAYDPNDKTVAPKGIGPNGLITLDQSLLTYTVRFQNTGNAPAFNVVVVDTLSDNLDITTLNITEVSHNYQLEVVDNKILKWKFYNIMLPDSSTNFAGSIGYFIYQLRMKNGLQIGDQIKNKAYIYFDYNPAIITNETVNTIYQPSGVNNWNSGETVIYPNPTEDILYIDAEQVFTHYRLMDASLRIVKQAHFTATRQQKVDVQELSAGIYFLQVGEGKLKKVVVR